MEEFNMKCLIGSLNTRIPIKIRPIRNRCRKQEERYKEMKQSSKREPRGPEFSGNQKPSLKWKYEKIYCVKGGQT